MGCMLPGPGELVMPCLLAGNEGVSLANDELLDRRGSFLSSARGSGVSLLITPCIGSRFSKASSTVPRPLLKSVPPTEKDDNARDASILDPAFVGAPRSGRTSRASVVSRSNSATLSIRLSTSA